MAIWAAACAVLTPAFADDLTITPATLPDGMEGVPYRQILFVEGGDRNYYDWQQVSASWTTDACSYQVSANETPLWEGRKSSGNVAYDLPFAFPFAGKTYDKVYVTTKGLVLFVNSAVDQNYVDNSELYYKHGFAPFWCDTTDVEAYVDTSVANEVSFRFESFSQYGTFAYRMTLKKDGTARYAYRQSGNTFAATDRRVIGVGFSSTSSDYVTVGAETDGIPATDIVFDTYGIPDGLQFRENAYQDPDTDIRGSVLTGTLNEACDVKFAVRACTNYVGVATNFYRFSIVRNPNRPPVIDAFAPADTNAVIFLDLGDTATFNVAVTDEAGDPFDVKWEFMSRDYEYASRETVGTETNLVFEATQARYEMQNSNNQPLLRCTVSDECWTNTVTWKVNIRRDWYVDAAADPDTADGSAEHPWPRPHTGGLQRGDTVTVAPGTYVWGPSDSTQIGVAGGATFRSTGSAADTKFVFQKKGYIHGAYNNRTTFQGFAFDGITFYGCDLVDCEIRNYDSADSYDGAIRCCSLVRCYVTGGAGKFHCLQSDIVDSTLAGNTISVPSTEGSARAVGEDCTLTRSIVVNNLALDGVEANVITDTTYASTAVTNSCTIPAMTKLGPGNYEAQPTFVSLAGGDLRLRAGSACIDAGDPANNTGAYKGPGVEGFAVYAFTDPVRGIFSDGSELQVVAAGATAYVMVKPLTDRAFLGWVTNGVEVAGVTTPELAIENIDCDYEVEALFEYREFSVNPTEADDSGDGTAAAPKKTIAAAAALALDGETIRLAEGTYEPFALLESSKVTLLGAGPDKTVIDGGGTNWCVRLGSNATLKNVAVVNGSHPQSSWYDYAGGVTGGTIENCVVSNCVSTRSAGGVANATVVSCLITGNSNTNEWSGYAGGLYHCKVYNSTIVGNIRLNSNVSGAESCYLFNNIITGNKSNGGSDTYDVYESRDRNLSSDVSSNVVYSTNLIGVDPWFVDAANGDYRLIAGSPAIDAGGEVFVFDFEHATDLAGERRIRNGVIDYGCYEGGVVTAKPAAPVATGMSAKAAKGIPFTWESVPNAAVYRIYRGTSDNAAAATLIGTTTATSYLDLTTTGGTDYFYWISAYANDEFGESAKCGPIAVTSYADLKIETVSLPAATEAVPYSVQLECSGNVGAATWSLPYTVYTREANTFDGSVGTAMETPFSSEYYGCCYVEFPFTFNWFGAGYTAVTVSTRGGIYFGKTTEWLSWGSTSLSSDMPKIAVLEGVSGSGDYSTITGVSVATNGDNSVTIVCTGTYGGYSSHPAEFSVTFYPDNSVRLAYGEDCIYGGYVAWSNGSDDTKTSVYRTRDISFAGMDDIVITSLLNESHLALSEDGLLSGVEDYAGTYRVTALVTDTDNGDVAYKTYTLTVNANANARPVIDATSPATGGSQSPATITKVVVPEGDSQTFAIAAHDPEGTALSYKWYLDDALVASGTNYTFTATELSRHTLTCEVSDALWTNGQVYAEWEIAVGKKFYVDAVNGTTNGTGTAGSPFKTINAALDEAISYEASTILVAPGTYGQSYLNGGWYSGGPTIVVRSTGSAADTFIDGNGRSPCVANYCFHDGFTFEGFTLRNGYADDYWTPSRGGGGSFMVNLKNCVVYNCTAESAGGGVFGATIDHCTIYGCSAGTGGGIDATSTAINSIVWGNTATNAGATATANYETGAQFENCCTTPLPEGANIAEDPQFVNAAGGDFHLADTSPCLAAGMGCYAEGGGEPVVVNYTVTFNANGGTCATATRSVQSGKAVGTLPTAMRSGYTLAGWYTAASGGTQVTASTVVTKDVTYYAHWTAIPKYTVTFNANGGTSAESSRQVEKGKAIGTLPTATRTGYTLAGWFTAASGGTQVTASTVVTAAITVYAHWTENAPAYALTIENGVLKGYTGTLPATLEIPATVTAFAANLFKGATALKAATGGANVVKCGAGAFRDSGIWNAAANGPVVVCGVLVGYKGTVPATVDVPYGVKVIADGAFAGASNLVTVYLPDSLVSIGEGAFKDCSNLDNVNGLESGVTVASDAFEGTLYATFRLTYDSSGTTVTGFKGQLPAALVLPAKVIGVGVGVFKNQATLTSLKIEGTNSVNLGSSAFEGCTKLATVSVGGSPSITATTFKDCTALQTLTVGGSATIAASAFQTCTVLKTVSAEGGATIGASAFAGSTALNTFTAGGGATVGASAFEGCTTLETFTAGDTVSIATNAFKGCVALATADFGKVSALGESAFEGCSSLASLELAEGIEEIGAASFKGCASLKAIDLPASVTTIGVSAFEGCSKLATVTGGENVRVIRTDAFAGTPWYETAPAGAFEEVMLGHVLVRLKGDVPASYEISSNVWMVANNALAGLTGLTDLYIGTEVVSLWDRAFAGCTSLTSVTVPSGCREFGDYLFEGCSSLETVFFRGHAPTNDVPHVFAGTPATLTVRIKEGSHGWDYPGSESDVRPARWPYQTWNGRRWQLVANDLNRAVYDPDDEPGVVRSIIVDGTITNETTWVGGKVYEVQRGCTVQAGATLTVEAGAIVKLPLVGYTVNAYYRTNAFTCYGKLVVNGTLANPVVFTSIRDDSWGGDTNGDGNRSEPYPGECYGVCLPESGGGVSVQATYAKFLYGHAANNHGANACLMCYNKEPSSFYGCEFSHAAMDGCFVAEAKFENCIFSDCDRGLVSISLYGTLVTAVNCVAYDNTVGFFAHTGSMYVKNSIAAFNSEYGTGGDACHVYATRCCLYNPSGENTKFTNSGRYIYNVDNIEADPLFLDPANGDFRISASSPCVDAAYGDVAPELDYYGQPRMDVRFVRNTGNPNAEGIYPDIGIYEVPGSTELPVMNLEVESVSIGRAGVPRPPDGGAHGVSALPVAPGETLTVSYTVKNAGDAAAKGSIRDVVRIRSAANGGTLTAGTVTQNYNLEVGASATLTARVAMPSAPAGEWLVGIDVNPNRDVFEQNLQKNTMWTESAVEVTLPKKTIGTSTETVAAGTTKGYVLSDLPEEGGVVVITTPGGAGVAPVVARVATGHMPTATMNDATSFVRADGAVVVVVPANGGRGATALPSDAVYLALENIGVSSATVTVKVEKLTTQLWSVYPEIAANVGDMGFTFTGAGLTATSDFRLGGIKAKSVTVVDSANVYAVFDIHNIAADRYYDVSADGKTLRDAVYINKQALGPVLDAKLELPERVRDNRIYTGYVVYENKGDTQMNAPTFIINYADSDTNTVFGAYDDDNDNLTQQRVLIIGLGASNPAGVLKPGDSGRLPFKFKPVGGYRFKLDSRYTSDEVANAATRLNLRGKLKFDGYTVRGLASLIKKGEMAAAVSGHFLDSRTREPLANAALKLTLKTGNGEQGTGNGGESFVRVVTTDNNGYFSFEQLKDGIYTLVADKGYALVTTNAITVAGQADVNGYEATAVPPGVVSGYVMGDDGTVVQYGEVALFRSASDMAGETVRTDGFGAYRFTGLDDGEYSVFAKPYESFKGQLATNLVVSTAARERRLDFALRKTSRAFGTVTTWKGGTVEGGEVRFYQEDGGFLKVDVSTNGTWEAAGVEPGKYSVGYISTDGRYDSANASVSLAAGDATEIPLVSQPATPFRTSTTFGVIDANRPTLTVYFAATGYANDTNIASVVWRFGDEGGKTYETNSVEIAHDYTSVGEFTVSTQPRYVDGTLGDEFEIENCIMVTNELETIYKDNAIVLGGYMPDDANFKTNAGTLAVVGVGDDWVKLTGSPAGVPLAAGSVIAGTYKDADGEDDWFLRRIVGVTGDATSGWTLKTEHGNEEDLYVQYWSYWSSGAAEDKKKASTAAKRVSAANGKRMAKAKGIGEGAKELLKKVSGSIDKGIEFEVECSPDIHYHYSCTIVTSYWRKVIKTIRREDFTVWELYSPARRELSIFGDVSIKADITANASFGGSWDDEQEYDLVPTAYKTIPSAAKAYPYFKIGYAASGSIEGSVTASAEIKGYLDIGFVKEDEKDIVWHKSKPFTGDVDISFDAKEGIDANIKLDASVSAGLGVKVKAFEVVTAKADVTFNAKASVECPKNSPSKAGVSIGYDTNVSMNFIDLTWLNKNWKVGMDWTIEGLTLWSQEWISAKPKFIYRQPHAKEWPARITVTDRSERGTYADARGRTFPIPIRSVYWDYGQGQTFHYSQSQIESGEYKKHRIIEFPGDQDEGEYTVSLNVQGGLAPSLWPHQEKIKIKKPEEDEKEEQTKIFKDEWFGEHVSTQKSVDPNEMVGPEGTGEQRYVKPGEWMTYTIYFENKADADAAAQEIWIDNKLSRYLDWSTFEMGEVSLAGQIDYGLVGVSMSELSLLGGTAASEIDQTNGLYKVRTEVLLDAATGLASWYIRVVDAAKRAAGDGECWPDDPDAGVLNPNVTVPEGEGYITYRVKVREDAPGKARIDNSATIVFDYNDPIVTDPAWWNTVYEIATVPVTIDGETTELSLVVGEPYGELPTPAPREGWTFVGWFSGPDGTGRRITSETIVKAGDRLYGYWKSTCRLYDDVVGAAPTAAAGEYNGYLVDAAGALKGTIQVKVGKPNKKTGLAAIKATVVPVVGRKISLKGAEKGKAAISADGPTEVVLAGGEACTVVLGESALAGSYGAYAIKGARNFFSSKNKAEQSAANALLMQWLGPVNVLWDGGSVTVTIAKKGKVKVKGMLADGKTRISTSSTFLIGEEWFGVPVVAAKAKLAFMLWLSADGSEAKAADLGDNVFVGRPGALGVDAVFSISKTDALWGRIAGEAQTDYLPDGVSVKQNGKKWVLPKAGKVAYTKTGEIDAVKLGDNPSGLKLTYKPADGSFKGSFKVYSDNGGRLKATTVNVTGVMIDGVGYGTATIKKVGSVPISIE